MYREGVRANFGCYLDNCLSVLKNYEPICKLS